MAWTKDSLEETVKRRFGAAKLVVVANREPYIHNRDGEEIKVVRPPGGLTAALDPVMRACGGTWIGHGSGSADRETADAEGRLAVPPEDPEYTLRRLWLTKEEEEGYYYGFANDAMWPLCHIAHQRPRFDSADWETYRKVNRKFADAVLSEVGTGPAVVFVQDYHFALLPRMLKTARPDLTVAQFWHIPWPNPEMFRICPWGDEILDGMLGNDLLSFQIQYHCNNFFEAVDRFLEAKLDREQFRVVRAGHTTTVRPHPISVDDSAAPVDADARAKEERAFRKRHGLGKLPLIVGVDRADYTKGIPERLLAVQRLLEMHPEMRGKFVFLQVGAPSRTHIPAYRRLSDEIDNLVEKLNWEFGDGTWQPVRYFNTPFGHGEVMNLLRSAAVCVVSSLHDGMNLVAKEFVAARSDERGALVLSRFTGSARELGDALLINPYSRDEFAEALRTALTMPEEEQERRMKRMRAHVGEHNIFRWAGKILNEAAALMEARL